MQKITPFLWFTNNAEEAMNYYVSLFDNSRVVDITYYPENSSDEHLQGMNGKVLHGVFELAGQQFMALDGGPYFKFNPSFSFYTICDSVTEIDRLFASLSEGGMVLMPLQEYEFAQRYAWLNDRYGVSWQLILGDQEQRQKIITALMFTGEQAGKAEEAMSFYTSLFDDAGIETVSRYGEGGLDAPQSINHAKFRLNGQLFVAMDSALEHGFGFNEAVSLYVECADQAEVDRLWNALSAVPESEQCGWLKDRYGVSWQIVPARLGELMADRDPERSRRVMEAIMPMKKLDVAELEKAYEGG